MVNILSDNIKTFLDLWTDCERKYPFANSQVTLTEQKTQDILHIIELDELDFEQKIDIVWELKSVRSERREYKDERELLQPLIELLNSDIGRKFRNQLTQVLGTVRKIENRHVNRTYTKKVENLESRQLPLMGYGPHEILNN